jgi:hypothetical protein
MPGNIAKDETDRLAKVNSVACLRSDEIKGTLP